MLTPFSLQIRLLKLLQTQAQQLGDLVGLIQLFHDTHWSTEKGWINEQARELHEKMIEMQKETQAAKRSEAEICEEVLGKASGFNQNFAFSVTQQQDPTDVAELRLTVEQQKKKRIYDLEEQLIMFEELKNKVKLLEEEHQKLFEIMNHHMTIAAAHAQSAATLDPQPTPSPIDDDATSSASAASTPLTSNI